MSTRRMALMGLTMALAGCATVEQDAATIATDAGITSSDAALLYGIVKGIAEVAELAQPELAPAIAAALAVMAGPIANIQAGITKAQDAALVLQTAAAVLVHVAPAIKVVASA